MIVVASELLVITKSPRGVSFRSRIDFIQGDADSEDRALDAVGALVGQADGHAADCGPWRDEADSWIVSASVGETFKVTCCDGIPAVLVAL